MKRTIAIVMLAGASLVAHAQWTGQAQTADSYTWGTPVQPMKKHRRPRPTYVNPPPSPAAIAVDGGAAMDPRTGQFYPHVGENLYLTPGGVVQGY